MPITVEPLSVALGAEIRGVDLSRPVAEPTRRTIHQAFLDHLVILFRDQDLSETDQEDFCALFGELELVKSSRSKNKDQPHIMFVSNVRNEGFQTTLEDGEMWFHSDQCYYESPVMATTLYAIEVPPAGGNTLFANAHAAYDALPEALRAPLEGRRALNVYDIGYNAVIKVRESRPEAPRWAHPVFRTHPETGRRAIYVNRLMTDYIEGMDRAESNALLEAVFTHVERPGFIYEHVWRAGDLLLWDNRCTQHARTDFDRDHRRILRRMTVKGEVPF